MTLRRQGRILAFQALYSWEVTRASWDEVTDFLWLEQEELPDVLDFSRLLVRGTIENIKVVDAMIRAHLHNWDFSRLKRVDLAILRMSTFTLMFQKDIATSIVIDEAIGIALDFGTDDSFRFINGVLDSIGKSIDIPHNQEQ
jgi:N utilization substance protein B